MTVLLVLALLALGCSVASAMGKCPAWVPLVLLSLYVLILQLPLGKP